jgi:competence protein ComEC
MSRAFGLLCIAFALGIALAEAGAPRGGFEILGGLALLAGSLAGRRRASVWGMAALAVGLCAGGLSFDAVLADARATGLVRTELREFEARVSRSVRSGARVQVQLEHVVARDAGGALPGGLQLWLEGSPDVRSQPAAGDRIRVRARVSPLRPPRNPGERDRVSRLRRAGVGGRAVGGAESWVRLAPAAPPGVGSWERVRADIGVRLGGGPDRALVRALGIGDTSALSPRMRERFAKLGLSHLLAVSGLHLAWVGLALCVGLQQAGRVWPALAARWDVRPLAQAGALVGVAGYAALSGFGIPVRRALVLVIAGALAARAGRPAPPGQALWLAAGAILLIDPGALFAAGAQLSFAACSALAFHARREFVMEASEFGWRQAALRALDASAVATAATAPLAAWHWGVSAPFSLLANAVAIPWVTLALLPASLLTSVALALELPGAPALLALATALARATNLVLAATADALPARPQVPLAPLAWAAASGLSIAALLSRRRVTRIVGVFAAGVGFALAPAPQLGEPPRVVALDVGRGDAILVQGETGALLVDGGSALEGRFDFGAQRVVPAVHALGIARLELVIATHADLDHRGGLPAVLEALSVGALWLPRGARADPGFRALLRVAAQRGVPVFERGLGDPVARFGDLVVTPVWPGAASAGAPRNESSLGVRVDVAGRRILLLGDLGTAEAALVRELPPSMLASDVLVLPHHGSRHSVSRALLARVGAAVTIVSAPCPAQRGLPHPESLARVAETGASLGWTGRDGAVSVALRPLTLAGFLAPPPQTSSCSTSRS